MAHSLSHAIEHQIRDLGWKTGEDSPLSLGGVEVRALGPAAAAFAHLVKSRVQR